MHVPGRGPFAGRRRTEPRRTGFTIVEILIVIALIGLLTALTVAGVSKFRTIQMARNTDATITKLQLSLDNQWKAVIDQCLQDRRQGKIPPQIVNYCNGDIEAAQSLWMYLCLRREFPQNWTEAQSDVIIPNVYSLPRRQTFAKATGGASSDSLSPGAPALLFMNLLEKGNRGMSVSDEVTQQAQATDGNFQSFMDAYGTPLTFRRFFGPNVTVSPSFATPPVYRAPLQEIQMPPIGKNGIDSLDPLGKLESALNMADPNDSHVPPWTKRQVVETVIGTQLGLGPGAPRSPNKVITVISWGQNKGPDVNGSNDIDPLGKSDDAFGYRLLRMGNKGE
jgi:prepilin-type N-terminal cleavage/methylation domain-containing protein